MENKLSIAIVISSLAGNQTILIRESKLRLPLGVVKWTRPASCVLLSRWCAACASSNEAPLRRYSQNTVDADM